MKGIFSGKQLTDLKNKGSKATRSQTAAQAVKAITSKYGTIQDNAKYYHKGSGVWQKYSIENDSKRTGKLAQSKEQWRAQPHKLDFLGIDTKKTEAKQKRQLSVTSIKAPSKPVSHTEKSNFLTQHKAVTKQVQKKQGVAKSKGHLMFIGDFEIYKRTSGDVYASRKNNYIDVYGYRADSRFLGTKEFWAVPKNRNTVIDGFKPEGYAKKSGAGMKYRYASFQRPLGSWFKPNAPFEIVDVKASDKDFRWKDRKPHSVIVTSQKLPDYTVKQFELVDLAEGRKLEALVKQVNKTNLTDSMKGQLENLVLSGKVKTRADINKYVEKGKKVMGKNGEAKNTSPYGSLKFAIRRVSKVPKPKKPVARKGGKALKMGDKFTYRPSKIQSMHLTQAQKEILAARKAARTPAKKGRAKKAKLAPREATEAKIRELEAEHNKLSNDVDKYTSTYNSYLKHIADARQRKRDTSALEANAKAVMDHVKKLREGITDVQEKVRLQKIKLNDIDAKEKKARIIDAARDDWNDQCKRFMSGNVPFRDKNSKECYNRHARAAGL